MFATLIHKLCSKLLFKALVPNSLFPSSVHTFFTIFVPIFCSQHLLKAFVNDFFSQLLFSQLFCWQLFVHKFCSELLFTILFKTFVHNFCSQLWLTTFVYNSHSQIFLASFVHNSCSQLLFIFLFTTHVPNSCSQLLLTTFTSFAHNFGPLHLLKTFVYNICSHL